MDFPAAVGLAVTVFGFLTVQHFLSQNKNADVPRCLTHLPLSGHPMGRRKRPPSSDKTQVHACKRKQQFRPGWGQPACRCASVGGVSKKTTWSRPQVRVTVKSGWIQPVPTVGTGLSTPMLHVQWIVQSNITNSACLLIFIHSLLSILAANTHRIPASHSKYL